MTQQCIVALVGLKDGGRFEIELVKPVDDLIQCRDILVEASDVYIPAFCTIAVGIKRVRSSILVVGEDAKILGPISERCSSVNKCVRARDVSRCGQALEKQAVCGIVRMPPQLLSLG